MLPKEQLPVSFSIFLFSVVGVACIIRSSSTLPKDGFISFCISQWGGTTSSTPPNDTRKSIATNGSVKSACVRYSSQPPNTTDMLPPLNSLEVTTSLRPPNVTSTFSVPSVLIIVGNLCLGLQVGWYLALRGRKAMANPVMMTAAGQTKSVEGRPKIMNCGVRLAPPIRISIHHALLRKLCLMPDNTPIIISNTGHVCQKLKCGISPMVLSSMMAPRMAMAIPNTNLFFCLLSVYLG